MLSSIRKTIGVFINKSDKFFESVMFRSIRARACLLGYDVFFFSTVGMRDSVFSYDQQERNMFRFAPVEHLDGIIVSPDNYELHGFKDALYEMLQKSHCPIVYVRCNLEDQDCVYTNERDAIRPILTHLLDDHKLTDVCFLAGYPGHVDGEVRLQCYREVMADHGMTIGEDDIFYGTMWTNDADKAYDHFFNHRKKRPQAIVCANDYMAYALMGEMFAHGLRVPDDVIITGFDNIESSAIPSLTTIGQDYDRMAVEAVNLLDRRIREHEMGISGKTIHRVMPGTLHKRESCGCVKPDIPMLWGKCHELSAENDHASDRQRLMTYFSIAMNAVITPKDFREAVIHSVDNIPEVRDLYVCLFTNNNVNAGYGEKIRYAEDITNTATTVLVYRDRIDMGAPFTMFETDTVLPAVYRVTDEPRCYNVILLHQQEKTFGYSVICHQSDAQPGRFYHLWNVIVSNALYNVSSQRILRELYEERRLSSITDSLTGLFNRRGFEETLQPEWEKLCADRETIAFVSIDMDNLKTMNDNWGHSNGDIALKTTADAVRSALPYGGIAARPGGDEFLVYIPRASEEMANMFISNVTRALEPIGQRYGLQGKVEFSGGFCVDQLYPGCTIEEMLFKSDKSMYEVKAKHKAGLKRRSTDR